MVVSVDHLGGGHRTVGHVVLWRAEVHCELLGLLIVRVTTPLQQEALGNRVGARGQPRGALSGQLEEGEVETGREQKDRR